MPGGKLKGKRRMPKKGACLKWFLSWDGRLDSGELTQSLETRLNQFSGQPTEFFIYSVMQTWSRPYEGKWWTQKRGLVWCCALWNFTQVLIFGTAPRFNETLFQGCCWYLWSLVTDHCKLGFSVLLSKVTWHRHLDLAPSQTSIKRALLAAVLVLCNFLLVLW